MAVRIPLKVAADGNLQEMSASEIHGLKLWMKSLYINNPSVALKVEPEASPGIILQETGNVGELLDTRMIAGAIETDAYKFPTVEQTDDITVLSVSYNRLIQSIAIDSPPGDVNRTEYPVYISGASGDPQEERQLRAMTVQDMYDTFAYDVINGWTMQHENGEDLLSDDGLLAGGEIYTVVGSTTAHTDGNPVSMAGYTLVDDRPIFTDTRANLAGFDLAAAEPVNDDPETVMYYYLFRRDTVSYTPSTLPIKVTDGGDLRTLSTGDWQSAFSKIIRYVAQDVQGYKIRYAWNQGTGNGTSMTDTRLNGTGEFQTYLYTIDEYRSREIPNGSPITINTYRLGVRAV